MRFRVIGLIVVLVLGGAVLLGVGAQRLWGGTADSPVGAVTTTAAPVIVPSIDPSANGANQDPQDQIFVGNLEKQGIPYVNKAGAITLAHAVCTALDNGTPPAGVAHILRTSTGTAYSDSQLGFILAAAVQSYCPAHVSALTTG